MKIALRGVRSKRLIERGKRGMGEGGKPTGGRGSGKNFCVPHGDGVLIHMDAYTHMYVCTREEKHKLHHCQFTDFTEPEIPLYPAT